MNIAPYLLMFILLITHAYHLQAMDPFTGPTLLMREALSRSNKQYQQKTDPNIHQQEKELRSITESPDTRSQQNKKLNS